MNIETEQELRDVLIHNGFVECDIPACNCGSWHHRYGLPERLEEIKRLVAEAGYPPCNENGHLLRNALNRLIADRDRLLVLATKHCPRDHHDWREILEIAERICDE